MPINFPALIDDLMLGLQHAIAQADEAKNNVHRQEGAIRLAKMLQADETAQAAEAASALAPAPLADGDTWQPIEPGTFDPTIGSFGDAAAPMMPPQSAAPAMPTGRKASRQTHGDRPAAPDEAAA